MIPSISQHLKQRLLFGSVAALLLFIIVYFSFVPFFQPVFVFVTGLLISLALLEYYHLAQHKGYQPLTIFGIVCSIIYVISVYLVFWFPRLQPLPNLILLISLAIFFLNFFNKQPQPLANLAMTAFGIVYLTIPLTTAMKINYFFPPDSGHDGRLWLAFVFAVTKMTDTGAYFFGKIFGKTKLAPSISPKKTVEGALGGLAAALLTGMVFSGFFGYIKPWLPISLGMGLGLSFLLSLVAQFGDLAESILKRDAGVKDSSRLPGLGGVLDVVDSLVFALPLMYLLLKMKVFES